MADQMRFEHRMSDADAPRMTMPINIRKAV